MNKILNKFFVLSLLVTLQIQASTKPVVVGDDVLHAVEVLDSALKVVSPNDMPSKDSPFAKLSKDIASNKQELELSVLLDGINESLDLLDANRSKLIKDFHDGLQTTLKTFMHDVLVRKSIRSNPTFVRQCCPVSCEIPCPPCNPCVSPCIVSGCFSFDEAGTTVTGQTGTGFIAIPASGFPPGTFQIILFQASKSIVIPVAWTNNGPNIQLISLSNTGFTVFSDPNAASPATEICFLIANAT